MSQLFIPAGPQGAQHNLHGITAAKARFYIEDFQRDLTMDSNRQGREAYPHLSSDGADVLEYAFDSDEAFERFAEALASVDDLMDLDDREESLIVGLQSSFPGVRGARAVFVDEQARLVLIGTSVVFNERHYTAHFKDPRIEAAFQEAQTGGSPTASAQPGVDLQELLAIAQVLRQRARPKLVDAVFDRSQVVDDELMTLAQRLEAQVVAAGGSLERHKVQVREAAEDLIQTVQVGARELREKFERGVSSLRDLLRKP